MDSKPPSSGPRLFHPILLQLPTPARFVLSGVLGNVFFVTFYTWAFGAFQAVASASRIFATVQFLCIILNHFLNMGIVFGWPKRYLASLMGNMPVGLVSLALGAFIADYLQRIDFDGWVHEQVGTDADLPRDADEKKGGFYASLVVMAVTGSFNYVALNIVNTVPSKEGDAAEKKEL